jgi:CubicO group peptidase (beta-lactamase class C family)
MHRTVRAVVLMIAVTAGVARADEPPSIVGLWRAKQQFGPMIRGSFTIERSAQSLTAEIAGWTAPVRQEGDRLSFDLPYDQGSFRGERRGVDIIGHWIQPRTITGGAPYASPVRLAPERPGRWRGSIDPLEDDMTLYLPVAGKGDGVLTAFLVNPERNLGRFLNLQEVVFDGQTLKLLGGRSGPKGTIAEGRYDAGADRFSVYLQGTSYDFGRASAAEEAAFFPRGRVPAPWSYRPPPAEEDGWPIANLEDVGLDRSALARFIQMLIAAPMESVHSSQIHAVLIARHGKLALEEYFHGFHRDLLHDTRSAAKSLTSVLTGAAILHGEPVQAATPVYQTMDGAAVAAGLEPRKRVLTVESLLTMSSGLDCDDSDSSSPGNEDTMQEQTVQPDWYRYTLDLKMVRAPGEKAVYCSCNPNLLGGVLGRTTGRWLPDLFRDLVAEPLQIRRYAMNLTPTGNAYMGGGVRLLARDFLKFGQLMNAAGRWQGRQVVSPDWAARSISPLFALNGIHYGYLWWVTEYPYKGRTVRAFFAGGNGGQVVVGIPELDLVVAFLGGNYSDAVFFVPQRVYVPEFILPAVQ